MTQTSNRFFDEMARLVNDATGAAQGVKREFDTVIKHQAEQFLNDMDLVKREEFEAVKEMARHRARGERRAEGAHRGARGEAQQPVRRVRPDRIKVPRWTLTAINAIGRLRSRQSTDRANDRDRRSVVHAPHQRTVDRVRGSLRAVAALARWRCGASR